MIKIFRNTLSRSLLLPLALLAACASPSPTIYVEPDVPNPDRYPEVTAHYPLESLPPSKTFRADAFFDFDSATITPVSKVALNDLVQKLQGFDVDAIVAVGYTDSVGSGAANLRLSFRRAGSVKAYLIGKGLVADKIDVEFHGSAEPREPNKINGRDNPTGRAKNRRVEVEVAARSM